MKLSFRPATATEDRRFIVSTWSSSYKKSHSAGVIHTDDWASIMHPQLERHLDRDGARALIACDCKDPNYFYGWIAGDTTENTPVIFYVYVKEPYRRFGYTVMKDENGNAVLDEYGNPRMRRTGDGIARQLFKAFGVDPAAYFVYVCGTPDAIQLQRKIPRARFNPNEVRYPKENRRRAL